MTRTRQQGTWVVDKRCAVQSAHFAAKTGHCSASVAMKHTHQQQLTCIIVLVGDLQLQCCVSPMPTSLAYYLQLPTWAVTDPQHLPASDQFKHTSHSGLYDVSSATHVHAQGTCSISCCPSICTHSTFTRPACQHQFCQTRQQPFTADSMKLLHDHIANLMLQVLKEDEEHVCSTSVCYVIVYLQLLSFACVCHG